jgi:hypothetical protein
MDKKGNGCLLRLLGALGGAVLGGLLAIRVGDPLGAALGISTFEGARGYFIGFLLLPLLAITGGAIGLMLAARRR